MRIKLIKIGNSLGVRLPKTIIKECGFESEIELEVRQHRAILSPVSAPRKEWEQQISDELVRHPVSKGEWQW